jgi:hypothetical protein
VLPSSAPSSVQHSMLSQDSGSRLLHQGPPLNQTFNKPKPPPLPQQV